VNRARRDLSGGRRVTGVPTAIHFPIILNMVSVDHIERTDAGSRPASPDKSENRLAWGSCAFSVGKECTEPEKSSMTNIRRFRTFRDQ